MSDSDMAGTSTAVEDIGSQLAGKYLTCELGHEVYALEILKVREIIGICRSRVFRGRPRSFAA